jgi:hypothetical protein
METSKASRLEHPLLSTFFKSFLRDVIDVFPEIDIVSETTRLTHIEFLYGETGLIRVLADFGKSLETSLITGKSLDRTVSEVYQHDPNLWDSETSLPWVLNPLWRRIGCLVATDNVPLGDLTSEFHDAIASCFLLRQFLLAFSKVENVEPQTDPLEDLKAFEQRISAPPALKLAGKSKLISLARNLLKLVLMHEDSMEQLAAPLEQWDSDPFGAHGPGAVAQGETGPRKWSFNSLPGMKEEWFDYLPLRIQDAYLASHRSEVQRLTKTFLGETESCSRACLVPKDFRKRRVICIEPKELQFMQQGLMRVLYRHIMDHPLTRGSIDFVNQAKSMRLARNYRFATIDLKDASDRVSLELARLLLPPRFFKLVTRFRSQEVEIQPGMRIRSHALATMGNALCFPLETLIFWSVSLATMILAEGRERKFIYDTYSFRDIKELPLRVFGDDIIIPRIYAKSVISNLESCGLPINYEKTCLSGLVRESCGAWWLARYDVRITRLKATSVTSSAVWLSLLESSQALAEAGMLHAARAILTLLDSQVPVPWGSHGLPTYCSGDCTTCEHESSDSCLRDNVEKSTSYRWNKKFQRHEFRMPVRVYTLRRVRFPHVNDGLYAFFTSQATNPLVLGNSNVEWTWAPLS